ncbi:MAG: hypothetical protein ACE366_10705 [Bradymonadia bacterium]
MTTLASPRRSRLRKLLVLLVSLTALGSTTALLILLNTFNQHEPGALRRAARTLLGPVMEWAVSSDGPKAFGPPLPEGAIERVDVDTLKQALEAAGSPHQIASLRQGPRQVSRYPFLYQDLAEEGLRDLDARLKLSERIGQRPAAGEHELDYFLRLSGLIRGLAGHTEAFPDASPAEGALELLDMVDAGGTLYCHTYSLLFVQSALALGHQARLIAVSSSGEQPTHGVAEVWSPTFQKWILVDTDYNMIYTVNGQPLSTYEVAWLARQVKWAYDQHLWATHQEDTRTHNAPYHLEHRTFFDFTRAHLEPVDQVVMRWGPGATDEIKHRWAIGSPTKRGIEQYFSYAIPMRSDFLSHTYPMGHPGRGLALTLPTDGTGKWSRLNDVVATDRLADMYWAVNSVTMAFESTSKGQLKLILGTFTPNFDHFEIRVNGTVAQEGPEPAYTLDLPEGQDVTVQVMAVNSRGVAGGAAELRLLAPKPEPVELEAPVVPDMAPDAGEKAVDGP